MNEKTAENVFLFIAKAFDFTCDVCLACVGTEYSDNYFCLIRAPARAYFLNTSKYFFTSKGFYPLV